MFENKVGRVQIKKKLQNLTKNDQNEGTRGAAF